MKSFEEVEKRQIDELKSRKISISQCKEWFNNLTDATKTQYCNYLSIKKSFFGGFKPDEKQLERLFEYHKGEIIKKLENTFDDQRKYFDINKQTPNSILQEDCYDLPFIDERDGNVYKTIKIGNQIMMAENFRFKPHKGASYWAYENNEENVKKYGYLYDWETAKTIAPKGWHLPTRKDWKTIHAYLTGDDIKVFEYLKEVSSFGYNTLFGGFYMTDDETFKHQHSVGVFWSSTAEGEFSSWGFLCNGKAYLLFYAPTWGFSVRLFRD